MSDLNNLRQRVAVATERNRQNAARRAELLAEAGREFGCKSAEELEAFARAKGEEAARLRAEADDAAAKAEAAVAALEAAVSWRAP